MINNIVTILKASTCSKLSFYAAGKRKQGKNVIGNPVRSELQGILYMAI